MESNANIEVNLKQSFDEQDVFSESRHNLCWTKRGSASVKREYRQRVRRAGKELLAAYNAEDFES